MSWLVARMDVVELDPPRRDLVLAWVARHGVDVDDVRPTLTVTADGDRLRLHVSRFVRRDGEKVLDLNLDVVATTPLVVDIDPNDPPPWFIEENR